MRRKIGILIMVIGFSIVAYFGYGWWEQRQVIQSMSASELNDYLEYDDTVLDTETVTEENGDHIFKKGEEMAELKIPSVEQKYPVFWGTDDETLTQGVGMHESEWTETPDVNGHTLLSGHRDTVFSEMGDLKIGDLVYVDYEGKEYAYQIRELFIVKEDDTSVVVEKDTPTLTISTCYPFQFVGDAPYRYIVEADLVKIE
ncbi:class D sortase [Halobacillus andaensis]|uniref:Class D sortase n=1 Tax=Halobacillus andaensis TaxID=1176239 RepID=A0A917BCZ4_HALAA|nr:class D sortase [Halobacillus andaensis]MBP2006360.1 sortase A [Halobacillus andaensis]GGF34549.1 class D sortase [Halobacillus andaensis]